MTQNCSEKLCLVSQLSVARYRLTIRYLKITMTSGTEVNLRLHSRPMDHTILNLSIRPGIIFFFNHKNHKKIHNNMQLILILLFDSVVLNNDLNQIVQKFSEHYHDAWASRKLENGWTYGEQWSDMNKTHPRLKPYNMLNDYEKERYKEPVRESLKALLAIGWSVEHAEVDVPSTNRSSMRRSSKSQVNQNPVHHHISMNTIIELYE